MLLSNEYLWKQKNSQQFIDAQNKKSKMFCDDQNFQKHRIEHFPMEMGK